MLARGRRRLSLMMGVVAVLVLSVLPALAITNGELDGEDHPWVVLVVADAPTNEDPDDGWRCTGTLLSPTIVLTAGHCVDAYPEVNADDESPVVVTGMRVFPASDVQDWIDNDPTQHYPGPGSEAIEAASWASHPMYQDAPFWFHDVGIIVLASPVPGVTEFGAMPAVDSLDSLKKRKQTTFTAVGYGLQQINGAFYTGERTRMVSYPHLVQINNRGFTGDFSLLLSNNHSTGGTCFGDSGGPNFLGDTNIVAGVTSFGLNGSCGGTGGVFRMDRQDVHDFVNPYLP